MKVNKNLFCWAMYDFANSSFTTLIVTFIYATYFTKAIAPDQISGTAMWSRAVTISAITVALLSPFLGTLADQGRNRKLFLTLCTAAAVMASIMLYFPLPGQYFQALIWFIIGNIAYELGCVFYNSLLPDIAPSEKIGTYSGIGWGLGYVGGLSAMFIAMVTLVNPETPWFGFSKELGQNIRATNLLVALWFGLFSLPVLLVKENQKQVQRLKPHTKNPFSDLLKTFKEIQKYRTIVHFLIARLIYNDGLVTIFAFGGIYAAGTFGFSFQQIMIFGIVLNITAGIGAFAFGYIDDRLGARATIMISLIGLTIAALLAVFTSSTTIFWLAGILVGIFSGPNQSASRSLMARLTPKEKESQFFGFYAFSGKFTAFLGPLLLGLLVELFSSQRAGMAVVIIFFVIGGLLLAGVKESEVNRVS